VIGLLLPLVILTQNRLEKPEESVPNRTAQWTLPIPMQLRALNPQQAVDVTEKIVDLVFFSRLIKTDEYLQIEPDAAESWKFIPYEKRIEFTLRPDIRFHSGKPLNADDVIFSFMMWIRTGSLGGEALRSVEGVEDYIKGKSSTISGIIKTGELSFSLTFREWNDSTIQELASPRFCIYPKNFDGLKESEFFVKPNGTGPFRLVHFGKGELTARAHENYHFGRPYIDEIRIRTMDIKDAMQAYKERRIDNLIMFDITDTAGLEAPDSVIKRLSHLKTFVLILTEQGQLKDKWVRSAIANRIDRSALISDCFPGTTPAMRLVPRGLIGSDTSRYSSAEFRQAPLNEVSANNKALLKLKPIKIFLSDDTNWKCLKKQMHRMLEPISTEIEVDTFLGLYDRLQQKKLPAWIEYITYRTDDPISTLNFFNPISNEYLLQNDIPKLKELFNFATDFSDPMFKAQTYRRIDEFLVSNSYTIPLLHLVHSVVFRRNVRGINKIIKNPFVSTWEKIYVAE